MFSRSQVSHHKKEKILTYSKADWKKTNQQTISSYTSQRKFTVIRKKLLITINQCCFNFYQYAVLVLRTKLRILIKYTKLY